MLNEIDKMVVRLCAMLAAYDQNVNDLSAANQRLTDENRVLKDKLEDAQATLMTADAKLAELENQPAQTAQVAVLAVPNKMKVDPFYEH